MALATGVFGVLPPAVETNLAADGVFLQSSARSVAIDVRRPLLRATWIVADYVAETAARRLQAAREGNLARFA